MNWLKMDFFLTWYEFMIQQHLIWIARVFSAWNYTNFPVEAIKLDREQFKNDEQNGLHTQMYLFTLSVVSVWSSNCVCNWLADNCADRGVKEGTNDFCRVYFWVNNNILDLSIIFVSFEENVWIQLRCYTKFNKICISFDKNLHLVLYPDKYINLSEFHQSCFLLSKK